MPTEPLDLDALEAEYFGYTKVDRDVRALVARLRAAEAALRDVDESFDLPDTEYSAVERSALRAVRDILAAREGQ